jgi:hypothetical protein
MYTKCENAKIAGMCSKWFKCGRWHTHGPYSSHGTTENFVFVPKHEKIRICSQENVKKMLAARDHKKSTQGPSIKRETSQVLKHGIKKLQQ